MNSTLNCVNTETTFESFFESEHQRKSNKNKKNASREVQLEIICQKREGRGSFEEFGVIGNQIVDAVCHARGARTGAAAQQRAIRSNLISLG